MGKLDILRNYDASQKPIIFSMITKALSLKFHTISKRIKTKKMNNL